MLFLVISHLKVVQYYHLVSFKFSAARVWQGGNDEFIGRGQTAAEHFPAPASARTGKYSGLVSPSATRSAAGYLSLYTISTIKRK